MIRSFLLAFVLLLSFSHLKAQTESDQLEDTLQLMLNQEKYQEITDWIKFVNSDTLGARSLYYTGVAHFVLEEDEMAEKYLKASIKKDPYFGGSYYYLGLIKQYSGRLNEAKDLFRSALAHSPGNSLYLEHLADVLDQQGLSDSAYTLYNRIVQKEESVPARVYMKIAEIFLARDAEEKALETYYDCLYSAQSGSEFYNDCLYNIGFFEYQFGNYRDASLVLETLHDRDPTDYLVVEKLVQVYLKMQDFNKVNEYRSMLYDAHKEDELPEDLSERFMLDKFEVGEKEVLAYEYFKDPAQPGDNKYAFTVLGENDSIQTKLYLEYSSFALGNNKKYAITETKEGEKQLYKEALFDGRINYQKLKETIIEVVEGELTPSESK